jgi:ABC-type multidrug transport system ATPase subunit
MALAGRASLLLLDEPTGSLDAPTRQLLFPLFDGLAPETTVVLCSHRLEEIRQLVDWVLALDEGRLVYDGPAADFLAAATTAWIEVRAEGAAAEAWLRERGFRRAGRGWICAVKPSEKVPLLAALTAALPGALRDVSVRDQESVGLGDRREPR